MERHRVQVTDNNGDACKLGGEKGSNAGPWYERTRGRQAKEPCQWAVEVGVGQGASHVAIEYEIDKPARWRRGHNVSDLHCDKSRERRTAAHSNGALGWLF